MTKKRRCKSGQDKRVVKCCRSCSRKTTLQACECIAPPMLLCSDCLPAHLNSPGAHSVPSLHSLPSQAETSYSSNCCLCGQTDASLICGCTFPPFPVCSTCISSHVAKPPIALHTPLPVSLRYWVTSPEYIETLRKRQQGKEQAKQILLANLARVEEAEKALQAQCKWLITAIKDQQESLMQDLWKIKEDLTYLIKTAVREVEEHLYEENYVPSASLATTIWNFHHLPVESELALFAYHLDADCVHHQLKNLLSTHVEDKGQSQYPLCIPILNSTSLRKFYFPSESISPALSLSSAVRVDMTSSWLFMDEGKIFSCGRHSPLSADTYSIEVSSGRVEELEPMCMARCQQGMLLVHDAVYVFGGLAKEFLSACEKYSLQDQKWWALPDMLSARDAFNPVSWRHCVYLVGGSRTAAAEVFESASETFASLPVLLPKIDCSIAFIDDGDLVVLQRQALYRWKLGSSEREYREAKLPALATWSNTTPVVFQHTLYYLNCWSNSIGKCGLQDLSFQQASFTY